MFNRAERRAIAQGKGFSHTRWCYLPNHVFTGVDADIRDAMIEEDDNAPRGYMPLERFDDLWADHIPDHPSHYEA